MHNEFAIEKVNNRVRNTSIMNTKMEKILFAPNINRLFPIPLFSFSKDLNSIMKIICIYLISQPFITVMM